VLLPAGAPQPIVARLESWFAEISKMDATRQYLANTYAAPFPGNAKALADFIPKEIKKWKSSRDSRRSSPSESIATPVNCSSQRPRTPRNASSRTAGRATPAICDRIEFFP